MVDDSNSVADLKIGDLVLAEGRPATIVELTLPDDSGWQFLWHDCGRGDGKSHGGGDASVFQRTTVAEVWQKLVDAEDELVKVNMIAQKTTNSLAETENEIEALEFRLRELISSADALRHLCVEHLHLNAMVTTTIHAVACGFGAAVNKIKADLKLAQDELKDDTPGIRGSILGEVLGLINRLETKEDIREAVGALLRDAYG